jgi:rod shape-determining protein MreC
MPKSFTEKLRGYSAHSVALIHQGIQFYKKASHEAEVEHLKLENVLLANQIQEVKEYLIAEETIEGRFRDLEYLRRETEEARENKELFIRKEQKFLERLQRQSKSIAAKVVYRDPAFWSEVFWIDVGHHDNKDVGYDIVMKNSPVVMGDVIVGIIDYVGKRHARVRMITDPTVCVAVRVSRGAEQNQQLLSHLNKVVEQLKFREDLFFSPEERSSTVNILSHLQDNLKTAVHDRYLAKGELNGSVSPLWRRRTECLKGVGFNYDYADAEGPARDLRTGEAQGVSEMLLKEGDLLVTTGMDGVFPEGFHVAVIEEISPLEEGAIAYELEARSLILNFDDLYHVSVLPPMKSESF